MFRSALHPFRLLVFLAPSFTFQHAKKLLSGTVVAHLLRRQVAQRAENDESDIIVSLYVLRFSLGSLPFPQEAVTILLPLWHVGFPLLPSSLNNVAMIKMAQR